MLQNVGMVSPIVSIFRDFFFQFTVLWSIFSNNEEALNAIKGMYIKFKGCSATVLCPKLSTSHMDI